MTTVTRTDWPRVAPPPVDRSEMKNVKSVTPEAGNLANPALGMVNPLLLDNCPEAPKAMPTTSVV